MHSLLEYKLGGIEINGYTALPYSADSLLEYALLGKNTSQDNFLREVQKGCELFVGIKSPEKEFADIKTKDGMFDIYQLGERGFYLAKKNGISAIFLDKYNQNKICEFVDSRC